MYVCMYVCTHYTFLKCGSERINSKHMYETEGMRNKALRVRPARGNRLASGGSGTQMEH